MFGWREAVVCLVIVGAVCGTLEEDLTKFKAVMDQTKTVDFLNGLTKDYSSYMRLCKAQININKKTESLSDNLKTGIAALNTKVESLTPEFKALLKKMDNYPPAKMKPFASLTLITKCEKIRTEYINSVGKDNIDAKQKEYRDNCFGKFLLAVDRLVKGWTNTDRATASTTYVTYIQHFRQLVYDEPKTMDSSVYQWIKILIRLQVLVLTGQQLKTTADDASIDSYITNQVKDMQAVVKNAKLILKSVDDSRMVQVKEDLIRYLKDGSKTACDKSSDLLAYLKGKYDKTDIAVIVFKGNKNVIQVCSGTYVFNIGDWNGLVAIRPAATLDDAKKLQKLNWMDSIYRSVRDDFRTKGYKHYAMSKELLSKIGSDQVCKKFTVAAIINADSQRCIMKTGFVTDQASKTVYRCNTSLCWIKWRKNFELYLVD